MQDIWHHQRLVPYWCHKRYDTLSINSSNSTTPHSSGVPNNLKANVASVSRFEYCSPQPWSPCKLQRQENSQHAIKTNSSPSVEQCKPSAYCHCSNMEVCAQIQVQPA
ncbi:uncharacterized protein M8220_016622 isoform 1-T2 [Acridotheres tristis]